MNLFYACTGMNVVSLAFAWYTSRAATRAQKAAWDARSSADEAKAAYNRMIILTRNVDVR